MNRRLTGILVNVVLLGVAVMLYPRLSAEVPTHWNLQGEVDGTMSKLPGAFLPSLMGLAICIVLPLLRRIDPRSKSYDRFDDTFYVVVNAAALLMALVQVIMLSAGLGYEMDFSRWIMGGVGVMFIVMGNYMPRIKSNWWMGIRTPWTLESEEVWRRTHRFGGRAFVAGGVIVLLTTVLPREPGAYISLAALVAASIAPAIYSYIIWRSARRNA